MADKTTTAPVAALKTSPVASPKADPVSSLKSLKTSPVASPEDNQDQERTTLLPASHWVEDYAQDAADDGDSAYSVREELSSTASIASSILRYREINGRTYHAEQGDLQDPILTTISVRQAMLMRPSHHLFLLSMDNKLHFAPLKDDISKVLDIGTGTGMWAIDFADEHPATEVIGTDISPIQPVWVPPNLKFELEDFTQPWTFPDESFDYVHMRWLVGAVPDWNALVSEVYRVLKPGGWIESFEVTPVVYSDDNSVLPGSPMYEWGKLFFAGGDKLGCTFRVLENDLQRKSVLATGFDEASMKQWNFQCPIGHWPEDKHLKEIGEYALLAVESDITGHVGLVAKLVADWNESEVAIYAAHLRRDMRSGKHAYYKHRVVWAQKPEY